MKISKIEIKNFRGISEVSVPLSSHVCAIGPNNSGKSSFLIALSLLLTGNKLLPSDFYNHNEDIVIRGWIDGISEEILNQLVEEHRNRIGEIIEDGHIVLVRRYDTTGKSALFCMKNIPKDKRFNRDEIDKIMSGKKGKDLKNAVVQIFPELQDKVDGMSTQKDFKELITELIKQLPEEQMEFAEVPLPTGIDKSIHAILPEPIYIPAVKDVTDDIKTKETTSFGKILRILLDLISETDELKEISNAFTRLKTLLNKEKKEDGTVLDERLSQIKEVESTVGKLLLDQFPHANLDFEIPPPELKTVFSSARIFVDDGIRDVIETKGDGMKRAVTFALLRGYVEVKAKRSSQVTQTESNRNHYLFLFEEPELYLHPKAQRSLYEALGQISKDHQVCVSTHSPYFFSPESTETFLRFQKKESMNIGKPPFSQIRTIDLYSDMPKKDAFQILCYENNNAAFFCDKVVLCEGDSDIIYLKHISRTISSDWDFEKKNIGLIQIGGKGNIARYREFFKCFEVPVQVILDLDAIVDQFDRLGASDECAKLREKLLNEVDKIIINSQEYDVTTREAKAITGQNTFKEKYNRTKEIAQKIAKGSQVTPDEVIEFQNLFSKEKDCHRCKVIREKIEIQNEKMKLITALRKEGIHVLLKGSIEYYYPEGAEGSDKPTRALSACNQIKTKEDIFKLCDTVFHNDQAIPELQAIFDNIFNSP